MKAMSTAFDLRTTRGKHKRKSKIKNQVVAGSSAFLRRCDGRKHLGHKPLSQQSHMQGDSLTHTLS